MPETPTLCCCGCNVHSVTKFLSILLILGTGVVFLKNITMVLMDPSDDITWQTWIKLIFGPVKFLAYSLMLYGCIKRKHRFYYPGLAFLFLLTGLMILLVIIYSIASFYYLTSADGRAYMRKHLPIQPAGYIIIFTVILALFTWLEFYLTGVIYCSYKLCRDERPEYEAAVVESDEQVKERYP